jgi:hypothetical protein
MEKHKAFSAFRYFVQVLAAKVGHTQCRSGIRGGKLLRARTSEVSLPQNLGSLFYVRPERCFLLHVPHLL